MDSDDPKLAELMNSASFRKTDGSPSFRFPEPSTLESSFTLSPSETSSFVFSTDCKESDPKWQFDFGELSFNSIVTKDAKRRRIDSLSVPILAIDTEYVLHENGLNNIMAQLILHVIQGHTC